MGFAPLKVTATLCGPVGGDVPMLDALLEWVMSRRMESVIASRNGHRHLTRTPLRPDAPVLPGAVPSPVARRDVPGFRWPVPLCSAPIFLARADAHAYYARRFDAAVTDPHLLADGQRRVFQASSGEFKSFRLPLRTRLAERVVWFCVGRPVAAGGGKCRNPAAEIRRLLRSVRHLGKKRSQGWGRVASWAVEDAPADYSWFAPSPAGPVLMRPLPACVERPAGLAGWRPWYGGAVPPYWSAEHFAETIIPC